MTPAEATEAAELAAMAIIQAGHVPCPSALATAHKPLSCQGAERAISHAYDRLAADGHKFRPAEQKAGPVISEARKAQERGYHQSACIPRTKGQRR